MSKPKNEYSIQTVVNALRVLEAFRDHEQLGVTELSRRLGLHKNNVFRLLATLELSGYIEQTGDADRYRLGVASVELGRSFSRSRNLLRRGRPILAELAQATGEASHLGLMRDFAVVHVDAEISQGLLSAGSRVGSTLPAHCTALGKVLLGCSHESAREAYDRTVVASDALAKRTEDTIVDAHKLFEDLRTVAVRGYAIDRGECERGLCCAAAPVFDESGSVIAALSVSGPECRMDPDRLHGEIAPRVTAAADRLSRDLGFAA
jgi:DNA-binding IclR family transcriptional regulator